ncbi:unnamed protein product [Diatraea saccharalis]|uniref:XPA C-terminal domain-containing protein n=1 Tax=Diatraea saccharalis TaxID=40085 RepID=A0A9N9RIG0_9NEOP|nr:unnamed protein product [Diatraea saccharalis]
MADEMKGKDKFDNNICSPCGSLSQNVNTLNMVSIELADLDGGAPNVNEECSLTAAQRARIERNRLKARALQDARLVRRPDLAGQTEAAKCDSGGGFLLEEEEPMATVAVSAPPAPLLDPAAQPHCALCQRPFACSYLFDTFDYSVCDSCRDDEDEHSLMTRTEAKAEFLLKDCDLDARPPPLRCVRRRNPHRGGGDMRLYLRAQLRDRALLVWGSVAGLDEERARRAQRSGRAKLKQTQRRLRALRMDVRSSLYDRSAPKHLHEFGPETYRAADDDYERVCLVCGHRETYEKM